MKTPRRREECEVAENNDGKRLITDPSNFHLCQERDSFMTACYSEIIWIVESHTAGSDLTIEWDQLDYVLQFLIGSQSKLNITACWLCSHRASRNRPPCALILKRKQLKRNFSHSFENDRTGPSRLAARNGKERGMAHVYTRRNN